MNWISKYLILALTLLTLVSCNQSPDANQNQERLSANRPRRTILDVPPENLQRRVIGMTNMVMKQMGDAVPDEKKEEVTMLVRGFFIADQKRKMTWAESRRMATSESDRIRAGRQSRYDLEDLYADTKEKAKGLLEKEAYRLLIDTLETYVRPPRPEYDWDDPDPGWLDP